MKKITNRDAQRILSYLQKARMIIEKAQEASDDGEVFLDENIAYACIGHVDEILIALNNTVLD